MIKIIAWLSGHPLTGVYTMTELQLDQLRESIQKTIGGKYVVSKIVEEEACL